MIPFTDEAGRLAQFPVAATQTFTGHAGVTALPRCAADAMTKHITNSCEQHQEFGDVLRDIARARSRCAAFIDAQAEEIALLGPTSLGLSLFANGLDWKPGDELLCYQDDYPANVYPWLNLRSLGVEVKFLKPATPGQITLDLVEAALTPRTRLVALASCHFLSGWRIDVDAIGSLLRNRDILFSLDAIQTLGAAPLSVRNVDFLSADAHKWMLGPLAMGIVYVARQNFERCRPTLIGAWNVHSPQFITQDTLVFPETAQRYEPGVLNVTGMYGMLASIDMLLDAGLETVEQRILARRDQLQIAFLEMGFETLSPLPDNPARSGILSVRHPEIEGGMLMRALEAAKITASLRNSRDGNAWLRFSPHFYNTSEEMEHILATVRAATGGRG